MAYGAIGATQIVLSEVSEDSPLALRAVRLQVEFLEDPAGQAGAVEAALEELLSDPSSSSNGVLLYVAGVIYNHLGRFDDALKLNQTGVTLENLSLCVAIGIAIDRPDFAEKMVKRMSEWDDDATITQLATAWLGAYGGGALARDALIIYEELGGRWSWTPKLLNGAATTCMVMQEWEEAEQHLMNALTKDPKDADTLANLYVVSKNLHKNAERYLSQLSTIAPDHPLKSDGYQVHQASLWSDYHHGLIKGLDVLASL